MINQEHVQDLPLEKGLRRGITLVAFLALIGYILVNEFHATQPFAQPHVHVNSQATIKLSDQEDNPFPIVSHNETCPTIDCAANFNASCLSPSCIEQVASDMVRVYPKWENRSWCVTRGPTGYDKATANWNGILLTKVPKAASTTSAGVAIRISRRYKNCHVQHFHHQAIRYQNRTAKTSFLFASVRDPARRAISAIFYKPISQDGYDPNDRFMLHMLRNMEDELHGTISKQYTGFQTRYMATRPRNGTAAWWSPGRFVANPAQVHAQVRDILNTYDFILVVERMDESLVAMSILLGIQVGDVLVTSSKRSGSYHLRNLGRRGKLCTKIKKSFVSPKVQNHLESDEWRAKNYADYLLHAAAISSLDATIDAIGRERFERELAEYKRLKALEKKICAPFVEFPCSKEGNPQIGVSRRECYLSLDDVGCGYGCIDSLVDNNTAAMSSTS